MWQVGDKIKGRYEIFQILGGPSKSGMGIVYVCYDPESKSAFALKTFQDRYLQDKAARDRFTLEAESWVKLEKHYNIVRAFFVETIEGRPYILIEYVVGDEQYGTDLSGWIYGGGLQKDGKPNLPLILNFSIQFCHGMMHAQQKFYEMGKIFVHRDIKPQNTLVSQDKVVKVTDFGLVKTFTELGEDIPSEFVGGERNRRLNWSKSGNVCGTPPYMSPEQCRGKKEIDARSDVYAFGCVLYEMLTGRYIFKTPKPEEFIYHHLYTKPESPAVHPELDRIVLKCLEKSPGNRYGDFIELEKELNNIYFDMTGKRVEAQTGAALEVFENISKAAQCIVWGYGVKLR